MRGTSLTNWEFAELGAENWRSAVVPGCVHLDLMRHGLIPDPHLSMNEREVQWVDERAWSYRCRFVVSGERFLRFECLDTVCTVFLNGREIARHDNMFLPLELDISGVLVEGENVLQVDFQPAAIVGEQRRVEFLAAEELLPDCANFFDRSFVRKAQYMFGWDWGPRLVSCGIQGAVEISDFGFRISDLESEGLGCRVSGLGEGSELGTRSSELGEMSDVGFRISDLESEGLGSRVSGLGKGSDVAWRPPTMADFRIERQGSRIWITSSRPERWMVVTPENKNLSPKAFNHGRTLQMDVNLWSPDATSAAQYHLVTESRTGFVFGVSSLELRREPDEFGESFEFYVDGKKFWAKGANWIPEHSFPTLVTRERLRERLIQAKDLGINMLRVWGGGYYEQEAFYDICDALGIWVWQDFMFSCALYPDDGEFAENVRRETEYQVKRLRHHPCIALWCGNNENQMLHAQGWGDKAKQAPRLYGEKLYDEVLREVVERLDPGRPYVPGSPIGGTDPNSGGVGDQHFWDVWHGRGDWVHYRESTARFCSEFGFASSPSMAVWKRAEVSEFESPEMLWHDKTGKPGETFKGYVGLHYPAPLTLEDWFYYSQLNQRDAMREAVEHFRMSPFCAGSLIWQLNDCWPVQSWSLIDCDGHLKAAAHELKRLYAPVLVSLVVRDGVCEVWAVSDEEDAEVPVVPSAIDLQTGKTLNRWRIGADLRAGERRMVGSFTLDGLDPQRTLLLCRGGRAWRLLCEPKNAQVQLCDITLSPSEDKTMAAWPLPVVDLFFWDSDLEFDISPNWITHGAAAFSLTTDCPIERIRARSLAGEHRVVVER